MKSFTKIQTARIAALLMLASLLGAGVQAAMATEQTLIMNLNVVGDIGTDPTISNEVVQGCGYQPHHSYTHSARPIETDANGNLIPWMAESYEISDDHRTITFHLRKGIKFADGTFLNASIWKFNFDRLLGYGLRDKSRLTLSAPVKYYDSSDALDEYTLKVQFTEGWPEIAQDLSGLSFPLISPWDVEPAWNIKGTLKPEKRYNGLGPYYVDENESISKEKIVLKRRHSWRDDLDFHKPKIDTIILTCITDPATVVAALKKGDINLINRYYSPTLESLVDLVGNPEITIKSRPSSRTYFISTAYWKEPFSGSDGILLRKAINYALDREEIVTGAFFGYATPATDTMLLSPLLPDAPECCYRGYDYNISKAKQILSDAGWKDTNGDGILDKNGKSLKDLDLVITSDSGTNAGLTWMKDVALIVQSQLTKVGISVKIRTLDSNTFAEATKNGDFDLRLQYTQYQPMTFQLKTFNSSLILYGNSSYANKNNTLENIAYEAGIATSEEVRDQNICQACSILYEDAGTIPLVHPMEYTVMSSKVKGYEFGAGNGYIEHIEECWIDDEKTIC